LKRFSSENLLRKEPHTGVRCDFDATKFYFISVRDPYEQYLSLYSFGCSEGRGGKVCRRFSKRGLGHLYDGTAEGFSAWLRIVLDPNRAGHLPGYRKLRQIPRLMGFQSYRALQLAMRNAEESLARCQDKNDIRVSFRSNNIVQHIIRTETLRADLVELLTTKLAGSLTHLEKAKRYVTRESIRNSSRRVDETWNFGGAEGDLRALVFDREWPLREFFGY
jgi:hypothetical protein